MKQDENPWDSVPKGKWLCPQCQRWVREPVAKVCEECASKIHK